MMRVADTGGGAWRPARSHLTQRRKIHVVIMIVRDKEQVHGRQRIQALSGSPQAMWACETNWATAIRPDRVGEHADAAYLQEECRMTDERR
jgi:hypothetical protein